MSDKELSALINQLMEDTGLREKLQGAADIDTALAIAKEAGFDVNKTEWLTLQSKFSSQLSESDLEFMAGGTHDCIAGSRCNDSVEGSCSEYGY